MEKNKSLDSNETASVAIPQQNATKKIPDDIAMATTHAAMLGVWDKEADRFWVRNNLMLIANGLLLGGAIAADPNPQIKVLVCSLGFFFSWSWLIMNKKSGHYVARWRPVIERYEAEMLKRPSFPVLPLTYVRPDKEASTPRSFSERLKILAGIKRTRRGAGGIMQIVIIGFLCAWVIFGLFYGFNLTRPLATNRSNIQAGNTQKPIKINQKSKYSEVVVTPARVQPPPPKPKKITEKGASQ